MCQDSIKDLEREEILSVVLEVGHGLPGCSGWILVHLARFPDRRHSRAQLMMAVNKSDRAVQRAVSLLVDLKVCTLDDSGRAMFTPEGFLL